MTKIFKFRKFLGKGDYILGIWYDDMIWWYDMIGCVGFGSGLIYLSINVCSFTLKVLSKSSLNWRPLTVSSEEEKLFGVCFHLFLEIVKW